MYPPLERGKLWDTHFSIEIMTINDEQLAKLINLARQMRERAYAPYSGYRVGAAALTDRGVMFGGCNVENASYGSTICAERNAVCRAIAEGEMKLKALAVVTSDGATICGACLQVISEFTHEPDKMRIILIDEAENIKQLTLADLLPHPFK